MSDRREQHQLWLPFSEVGGEILREILAECLLETIESGLAFEGFIEAPVGQDDVGVKVCAGVINDIGVSGFGREGSGLHVEEVFRRGNLVAARMDIHLIGGKA